MFIKDLQPRQTNVDVEGDVLEITDVREFNKFGKTGKVSTALLKDDTGKVKLSLWNEQTEKVKAGDKVKVTKGYVGEFQGELQLTTGKFGTLEVISNAAPETVPAKKEAPKKEEVVNSTDLAEEEDDDSEDAKEEFL